MAYHTLGVVLASRVHMYCTHSYPNLEGTCMTFQLNIYMPVHRFKAAIILFSCCHSFSFKCHFQEDVEMKDSTTSQEDDESEDEGLEEVLSGAHNLEQVTLILSLNVL